MTKEEALKLVQEALEALENISTALREDDVLGSDIELMLNTIGKIHAALAQPERDPWREAVAQPEQEPVAWIHNFIEGGISIGKRPSDLNRHPDRWTALYRESKPCPTCEALARTVMLDQTSHDTKRPWVNLTVDELIDLEHKHLSHENLVRAIEAKLREKNT